MSQSKSKPGRGVVPDIPGWVKVSGIIVIVLVLLVGVMLLAGHDPSKHLQQPHPVPTTEQGAGQP